MKKRTAEIASYCIGASLSTSFLTWLFYWYFGEILLAAFAGCVVVTLVIIIIAILARIFDWEL